MTDEIEVRIAEALAKQGSNEYKTPSGPTLTLMNALLEEKNLQGYAQLYNAYKQTYPSNLPFIDGNIPAQIRNFLIRHRDVDVFSLEAWATENAGWEDDLRNTLCNPPMFEAKVEAIAGEMRDKES